MCKNTYPVTLNPFIYILISFMLLYPSIAMASNKSQLDSVITLPIEADLKVLEHHLNDIVPNMLTNIEESNRVCIKPKHLKMIGIPRCTKDGYKISCKDEWIKIKPVPRIKCDVKGWIKRNGPISVSGRGETLKFAFPVKAQVSTKLLGIRETANAAGTLYINATPTINKDWSLSVDMTHSFTWSNKPSLKLFNSIHINIKSILEPKLRKQMDKFEQKLPELLNELDIKGKMAVIWKDIQEPLKIDDNTNTYLLFKPETASCSQINIVDQVLQSTISARGKTHIILGRPPVEYNKTELTDLEAICYQKGKFDFNLPLLITYDELLALSKKKFSDVYTIDMIESTLPGILMISNPRIRKGKEGKISITAHVSYDNRDELLRSIDKYNWFDINGEITFTGLPRIDKDTRTLVFDNLVYDSSTNSDLFDLFVDAAEIAPIQSYFESLITYEYGQKIDGGIKKINKALKEISKGFLSVSGRLNTATIEDIMINEDHITINTKLSGKVHANIGLQK